MKTEKPEHPDYKKLIKKYTANGGNPPYSIKGKKGQNFVMGR